tara:strand:+ start:103 stop:582 length:480 start_codon:yes stop_codon:yes gene_type:complete
MTTTITGALGIDNIKAATGAVLQVIHANKSGFVGTASDTMVDTGITANITPSSTSSKILVTVHASGPYKNTTGTSGGIDMNIVRGSTPIHSFAIANLYTGTTMQSNGTPMSATMLDSPSTTSATTYKVQFKRYSATGGPSVGINASGETSTITLQEIAG